MKFLASVIIFTKLSTKTLLLWRCRVELFEYQGLLQNCPHRSYCFLSRFKLRCKRHYRNLATYSLTGVQHDVNTTKMAPARHRHSVGGGGGAVAAAHSSTLAVVICALYDRFRGDWKRETWHRETCFTVRVEAHYKLIFAAGSIIWAAHRLHVYSFT